MDDEHHPCVACGRLEGRHPHFPPDIQDRLKAAPPGDRWFDPIERSDNIRVHIDPGEIKWVCDRCAPVYQETHSDFYFDEGGSDPEQPGT